MANIKRYDPVSDMRAEQLLILLAEHKANCHSENCRIQLGLFQEVYEKLAGRKATKAERWKYFC